MKHALILGASGGIGSAIAKQLKKTYKLSLVGRDIDRLKALKNVTAGDIIPTDVASELEVQALFEHLEDIDVLIYSVGDIQPELLKQVSGSAVQRVIDANLLGFIYTLRYAEAKLTKDSRVFVLGARPELINYRGFSVYAASKAAVKALVDIAAVEMKRKTSFTLVLPKAVDTAFWDNVGTVPKDALLVNEIAQAIEESLLSEGVDELLIG